MSSFASFVISFAILIAALVLAATLLGVSSIWIGVGVVVMICIAILTGVTRLRRPDRR
jgi:hypothetical protein